MMSSIDLNEAIDSFYKNEEVNPEAMQVLIPALRQLERGNNLQIIAEDLGVKVQQIRELEVRRRGWELSRKYKLC